MGISKHRRLSVEELEELYDQLFGGRGDECAWEHSNVVDSMMQIAKKDPMCLFLPRFLIRFQTRRYKFRWNCPRLLWMSDTTTARCIGSWVYQLPDGTLLTPDLNGPSGGTMDDPWWNNNAPYRMSYRGRSYFTLAEYLD